MDTDTTLIFARKATGDAHHSPGDIKAHIMDETEVAPMETSDGVRPGEDETVSHNTALPNGSHSLIADDASHMTQSTSTDLFGFATPSEGQTMASSGDLLGFSTPPEEDVTGGTDDLLDFASPPRVDPFMASDAKSTAGDPVAPVMRHDNTEDGDLLGFALPEPMSAEAESTFVAAPKPLAGQNNPGEGDLLGFASRPLPVEVNNTSVAVAGPEDLLGFASSEESSAPAKGSSPSPVEAPVEQAPSVEQKGSRVDELLDFASPLPVGNVTSEAKPPVLPNTESVRTDNLLDMISSDQTVAGQDNPGSGIDKGNLTPEQPLAATAHTEDNGIGATTILLDLMPPESDRTKMETAETESSGVSAKKENESIPPQKRSMEEANEVIVNKEEAKEEANATGSNESPLHDDEENNAEATISGDEAEMDDVSLTETKQHDMSASVGPPVPSEAEPEHQHETSVVREQVIDPWAVDCKSNEASNETTVQNETEALRAGIPEFSATMVDIPPSENEQSNEVTSSQHSAEKDVLLVELQSSLQDHMSRQAEAEDRARKAEERVKLLEKELRSKGNAEEELTVLRVSMMAVVSDKAHLELELAKLRIARDEHERKEIVLSNRLNAAKKKESVKANLAEQFEEEAKELRAELAATKEKLKKAHAAKEKNEQELRETKEDMTKRVNLAETALADERRLNEDRKRKMKVFIETKQEEVRLGKVQTDELTAELEQTNRLLREQTSRWKQLHAQWVQSQTRNRELQRDLNRIKKDSDNMHKIGDKMEMKLSRSAQETEEHKSKRLTAKHELMTVLRTLEGEREVSSKLRDSLKFTFTPKALSQQQLLKESLQEFEAELQNLSRRLGRPYLPPTDSPNLFSTDDSLDSQADGVASADNDEDANDKESVLKNRSEIDSTHLISNLENETQRVSQCIMALMSSIERMHALLEGNGTQTCFTALTARLVGSSGSAHGGSVSQAERASMTGGRAPAIRARSTRYGQLPTDPD